MTESLLEPPHDRAAAAPLLEHPALAPSSDAGRVVGRWRVLGRIGQGGFADVFTALPLETAERLGAAFRLDASGALVPRDGAPPLDAAEADVGGAKAARGLAAAPGAVSPVALKVARPGGLAELARGARTQRSLDHPGIVKVLELSLESDPPHVALEWARGGSLRDVLARRGRLSSNEALRVVERILHVLEHAHGRGVVHGDVKPENVLVEAGTAPLERRVRLTDFGLRRRIEAAASADALPAHSLAPSLGSDSVGRGAGTPVYLAPEVAAGAPGDARIDVYACGVLAFELATGRRPLGSDFPSDLVPEIPKEFDRVVREAMRGDPGRRYRSAAVMRDAIREVLGAHSVRMPDAAPLERGDPLPSALGLYRPRYWPLFAAAGVGAMLGSVSLGVLGAPVDGMLFAATRDALEGRPARPLDHVSAMVSRWPALILALWIQIACILLGLALLLVPGIYLLGRWLYVTPAIALEGLPLGAAFRRSAALAHAGGIGRHMALATALTLVSVAGMSLSWVGAALVGPLCAGVVTAEFRRLTR